MLKKHGIIFNMNTDNTTRQRITPNVVATIHGHGRGWLFTPRDLSHVGDPRAIGVVLTRLVRKGTIRQIARGLYDYPVQDPQLGPLFPSLDKIADALRGRSAVRLQPSGAYAANLFGLSEQVPMKAVFLTDGPSRNLRVGNIEVILKRTTPQNMATAGRVSGLLIQALRAIGRSHVDAKTVDLLRKRLSADDRKVIARDIRYAPAWIAEIMRQLTHTEGT